MKAVGLFILKSIAFTIIFWSLWLYVLRPISSNSSAQTSDGKSGQTQQNDSDALMKKYWEQVARADQIQAKTIEEQQQAEVSLAKQDELLSRWEKVIEKWERASTQRQPKA
jgi:hypothetical protein